MILTLPISAEVEEQLRLAARAAGLEVGEYARRLLEGALARPSIDAVLEPYRRQVADSGMSDETLDEFHRGLIDEVRRARKSV